MWMTFLIARIFGGKLHVARYNVEFDFCVGATQPRCELSSVGSSMSHGKSHVTRYNVEFDLVWGVPNLAYQNTVHSPTDKSMGNTSTMI